MNLANMDCMGQDDLCKDNSSPIGAQFNIGDYKEPDYMEPNNFTPNYNESHCAKIHSELFCVTEKDLDCFEIDDLF